MGQIVFDEEMARQVEALYRIRDAALRRGLVREKLAAQPGERVLDVGCGPGFYCLELAEEVGEQGSIVGIDSSEPMLSLAERRCEGLTQVGFKQGDALSLPVEDEGFDAGFSVQVLEYVPDATAALREIFRTIKPGGRTLIWDIDWDTLSMQSADRERWERVDAAWDTQRCPRIAAPHPRAANARSRFHRCPDERPQFLNHRARPRDLRGRPGGTRGRDLRQPRSKRRGR